MVDKQSIRIAVQLELPFSTEDDQSVPRTAGVYRVTCQATGKFYLGSAINLRRRRSEHFSSLRRGIHYARRMQAAWNDHGEASFAFEVVEEVPSDLLLAREQAHLDLLRPWDEAVGFNRSVTAACSGKELWVIDGLTDNERKRFWSLAQPSGECWLWCGPRDGRRGYGFFCCHGVNMKAHRVAYTLGVGPIGHGLWVLHRCDNPPCINPDHLFLGTRQDNMKDAASKGRISSQARPESRARGEQSHLARLTEEQVKDIRRRRANGEAVGALAVEHGISLTHAGRIIYHDAWQHVDPQAPIVSPRSKRSNRAKLSDDQVREIRRRKEAGETYKALGIAFGLHWSQIYNIVKRKCFGWLE